MLLLISDPFFWTALNAIKLTGKGKKVPEWHMHVYEVYSHVVFWHATRVLCGICFTRVQFLLLTWQQDVMDNIIFLFKYPPATIKLCVIPVSRINKTMETYLPQT